MKRKIVIIVCAVLLIGAIALLCRFLQQPRSGEDLFLQHLNEISYYEDDMCMSVNAGDVQIQKSDTYYIDSDWNLVCRTGEKDEKLLSDISSFLIRDDKVFYLKYDGEDGLYCRGLENGTEKQILEGEIEAFALGEERYFAYVEGRIILFNTAWREQRVIEIGEKYKDILFQEILYADGHVVFYSQEGEIYTYSLEKDEMRKLDMPLSIETHVPITDVIKKGKNLYYLVSVHEDADLCTKYNREDRDENGVYRVDVAMGQFYKVSDTSGFSLFCLEDELYVEESGYLFTKLKKCEMVQQM